VHVPFCASRCAYCDFNTYTASELRGRDARAGFAADAIAEVDLAARTLSGERPLVSTVFFGGGTPTLLPAVDLVRILRAVDERLGLVPGAEVTVEANPESVDPAVLALLREHGVTRVSLGMQSVAPHVLAVLERAHTPGRAQAAAAEARAAGFEHVSLDLIFGTPGETDADWAASLDAALAAGPDHVSVYGLTLAAGTRLDARVRRGDLPAPDDDAMADRYLAADAALGAAGLGWYELSNWAAGEEARCRHNVGYWRGADWWGVGPGAHSHLDGRRWWNVRHPSDYAARLAAGHSPAAGAEVLAPEARRLERIMLETRTADGLDAGVLRAAGADAARRMVGERLLEDGALAAGRVRLTLGGRLVADAVVRSLADA
jgi:putative oxygen-independent coproporphyrinogen III oxidase